MDVSSFVGKLLERDDVDALREGVRVLAQAVMETEVSGQIGAAPCERSSERIVYRNGYRTRRWDTRVGTIELKIPEVSAGAYFPSLLEPRRPERPHQERVQPYRSWRRASRTNYGRAYQGASLARTRAPPTSRAAYRIESPSWAADLIRRYVELHLERLEGWLADQRVKLRSVERFLATDERRDRGSAPSEPQAPLDLRSRGEARPGAAGEQDLSIDLRGLEQRGSLPRVHEPSQGVGDGPRVDAGRQEPDRELLVAHDRHELIVDVHILALDDQADDARLLVGREPQVLEARLRLGYRRL
jgi:hypothetical protein